MKFRTRIRSASAVAAATALIFTLMPAGVASAHGYVSAPPSRQAQCAAGWVECGGIKWEPQSVEGPKGLTSCSGGNARFSELDDDDRGWYVTPVGTSLTFTWTLTAMHSTADWEYYIGGDRIAHFEDGGARPPSSVTHAVDLSGYSGRQKVLAVWNIADTANAFYACVDVSVGAA
ncbi:lytic polysaccharide monooxygenase auxiliary activity family 9 protein [Nocardiopsis sp. NRRL B-16309]|uniref:lytic polysaccharide monooxygenase auxiliary activity family 9 protein n=1 Tax=Nocardiopsis sp. NRRL B-16309 TaxID=1519494 RepID=UPI0006AD9BBF|nr:lytic polysaccharide monooxygenase auxiliary activity family 9 protein [Nocardiopsis sp. NRRL B-16309]KOX13204.1 chitin-binding protein [Nocardiopsis sp. NRRL B-16309]